MKKFSIPAPVLAALGSYFRAGIASVLTLIVAGVSDPKQFALAFITAFAGPVIKWLDPSNKAFGLGAKGEGE